MPPWLRRSPNRRSEYPQTVLFSWFPGRPRCGQHQEGSRHSRKWGIFCAGRRESAPGSLASRSALRNGVDVGTAECFVTFGIPFALRSALRSGSLDVRVVRRNIALMLYGAPTWCLRDTVRDSARREMATPSDHMHCACAFGARACMWSIRKSTRAIARSCLPLYFSFFILEKMFLRP